MVAIMEREDPKLTREVLQHHRPIEKAMHFQIARFPPDDDGHRPFVVVVVAADHHNLLLSEMSEGEDGRYSERVSARMRMNPRLLNDSVAAAAAAAADTDAGRP